MQLGIFARSSPRTSSQVSSTHLLLLVIVYILVLELFSCHLKLGMVVGDSGSGNSSKKTIASSRRGRRSRSRSIRSGQ